MHRLLFCLLPLSNVLAVLHNPQLNAYQLLLDNLKPTLPSTPDWLNLKHLRGPDLPPSIPTLPPTIPSLLPNLAGLIPKTPNELPEGTPPPPVTEAVTETQPREPIETTKSVRRTEARLQTTTSTKRMQLTSSDEVWTTGEEDADLSDHALLTEDLSVREGHAPFLSPVEIVMLIYLKIMYPEVHIARRDVTQPPGALKAWLNLAFEWCQPFGPHPF